MLRTVGARIPVRLIHSDREDSVANRFSPHLPDRCHGDATANGHCRDPRGTSVLRAIPSLPDSGRSVDASNTPLQTEAAPNVPAPTCNGDPPVSNILRSKRIPRREEAQVLHK